MWNNDKSGLIDRNAHTPSRVTPIINRERMERIAPSVFASTPWQGNGEKRGMSDRYCFVPTIQIVDTLADKGFLPVRAQQSSTRIDGKGAYTRHMIRFRHESQLGGLSVGEEVPELVLVNSHDGTSAYQFSLGIYRLVCSNGMVVQSGNMGSMSVRHLGGDELKQEIIDTTFRVMAESEKVMENIGAWKGIELNRPQQLALASAALELKDNKITTPEKLLDVRRAEDRKNDLWTTTNRIQEHLLKGGDRGRGSTGKKTTTRSVKSVTEDLRLNRALWVLTESLANTLNN